MSLHPALDKFANPKRVRTSMNPITSELEHVILDAVQLAFERTRNLMDAEAKKLGMADARRYRDKLAAWLAGSYSYTDSDLSHDAVLARLVMVLARRNAEMSETITRLVEGGK